MYLSMNKQEAQIHKGKKKKVILIGMDGLMPEQIDRYKDDIPELRRFLDKGFFAPAHSSPFTDTATNWPTIATGSWVGTHGCTGFEAHLPGMELGETVPTFNSELCQSEYFWNAAERQGKRSILINYPCAFPRLLKKGVVIGGDGLRSKNWTVRYMDLYQTHPEVEFKGLLPNKINLGNETGWKNVPEEYKIIKEGVVRLDEQGKFDWTATGAQVKKDHTGINKKDAEFRYILVFQEKGVTKIMLSDNRDAHSPIAVLAKGQWSGWVRERFSKTECLRQYKLIELTKDGSRITIFGTIAASAENWGYPAGIERSIIKNAGGYIEGLELDGSPFIRNGNFSEIIFETMKIQAEWIVDCASYLDKREDWDNMWIQFHAPDGINHAVLGDLESDDEKIVTAADDMIRKTLRILFKMAEKIIDLCADENTVFCIVSDHGNLPKKYVVYPDVLLHSKGWLTLKGFENDDAVIDPKSSKACSGTFGIWINKKGRDKYGCVEPGEEYEKLRSDIINELRSMRDPDGECPFALIGRREDFQGMGMWGERIDDIVCFPKTNTIALSKMLGDYPIFKEFFDGSRTIIKLDEVVRKEGIWDLTAVHMGLPEATAGYASNRAILMLGGSGIKEDARGVKRINLVDVAPTLAYLLGIDPPEQSEGRIIREALEDQ